MIKGRIKNVLNYRKPSFWAVFVSIIVLVIVGTTLITNPKKNIKDAAANIPSGALKTNYNKIKIEFLSDMMGFKSANEFETDEAQIVAYIDSILKSSLTAVKVDDLENNNI